MQRLRSVDGENSEDEFFLVSEAGLVRISGFSTH